MEWINLNNELVFGISTRYLTAQNETRPSISESAQKRPVYPKKRANHHTVPKEAERPRCLIYKFLVKINIIKV